VADGGGAEVVVPLGSKICNTVTCNCGTDCRPFDMCKAGTKGSIPANESCILCPQGYSSVKASTKCDVCAKGKYNNIAGTTCTSCEAGRYKDEQTPLSATCFDCPTGFSQANEGSATCLDLNWKSTETCSKENDMYLNDNSSDPSQWNCQPCTFGI